MKTMGSTTEVPSEQFRSLSKFFRSVILTTQREYTRYQIHFARWLRHLGGEGKVSALPVIENQ
jgi:hypothetical protein